jgi:ribosomal protein L37AE/L43A
MAEQDKPQAEPTPVEVFLIDWRSRICPLCQEPLDLQQRNPLLWFCAMCRKWFNGEMKTL